MKIHKPDGEDITICKVRGLTLNHETSSIINFDSIKQFVLDPPADPLVVLYKNKIQRKRLFRVVTSPMSKKYNQIPPKRRLLDDLSTVPFGYKMEQ